MKQVLDNFAGGVFVGFILTMMLTAVIFGYGSMPTSMIRDGVIYVDNKAFLIKELK